MTTNNMLIDWPSFGIEFVLAIQGDFRYKTDVINMPKTRNQLKLS